MNTLADVSNALTQIVEDISPSILRVEARRRLPASGIVWSSDGLVVSANHVVKRDDKIKLGLADGSTSKAKVIGRDATTDLVLLQAEAKDLSTPRWVANETEADVPALSVGAGTPKVGCMVLALGRPGNSVQATLGILSAVGEAWTTPMGGKIDRYIQTDVVMYPGFSGGPLVGATGCVPTGYDVLGLNSSHLARGVSVAVPVSTLKRLIETLASHGRVRRGYLGVSSQIVNLPSALAKQLGQETGLLVVSAEADSPAEAGGLLLGDTIVALDGFAVRDQDDLLTLMSTDRIDKAVPVKLVRGGQVQTLQVTIGERYN